jgi:hypothetical protein
MPLTLMEPIKAEPERGELEQLQLEITMQQAKISAMQEEAAGLANHIVEIAQLASALKIRVSEGDGAAVVQLDALEIEQRSIERRREGLSLRLVTSNAEMQPLVRQANAMAAERDFLRQEDLVKQIAIEKDRLIAEILASWERSCEAAYDLMNLLDGGMSGAQRLDEEHRRTVFSMNTSVGERLQAAALVHVNLQHQFVFARSEVFARMKIIPAKRKESLRAAG